jgi:hypothetical protein
MRQQCSGIRTHKISFIPDLNVSLILQSAIRSHHSIICNYTSGNSHVIWSPAHGLNTCFYHIFVAAVYVPAGHKILSAIWAFKQKRHIDTRAVYKHKARINVHGGQHTYGFSYWESFSPVVNWFSIRLTLVLSLNYQWKTRQIDFALAFPQADVECELYMELPRGPISEG